MSEESREISTLDFANLIGGPLNAIVEAQAKSAVTTATFIKSVGFKTNEETGLEEVVNVDFKFARKDDAGRSQTFKLTVPFLTMIPIPYITVDEGLVEFNAKITSVRESKSNETIKNNTSVEASAGFWFTKASVTSQTSYQQNTSATGKVQRSYDMNVRVKVRNADMPRGTERILDILQDMIEEVPVSPVKAVTGTISELPGGASQLQPTQLRLSNTEHIRQGWTFLINGVPAGTVKADPAAGSDVVELKATPTKAAVGYTYEARQFMNGSNGSNGNGGLSTTRLNELLASSSQDERVTALRDASPALTAVQLRQIWNDGEPGKVTTKVKAEINRQLTDLGEQQMQ